MASISLLAISIVDFLAAIMLFFPFKGDFMMVVGLMLLAKGIWSMISSVSSGFYFDAFGFVDFLGAIIILVVNFGTPVGFAWIIGMIILAKAAYATLSSI